MIASRRKSYMRLQRVRRSVLEPLEQRRLLCFDQGFAPEVVHDARPIVLEGPESPENAGIIWVNRANTASGGAGDTDGFGATFGASAHMARAVVDAVILQYQRMIGDFNFGAPGAYGLTLSMDQSGGFGGSLTQIGLTPEGKPGAGTVLIRSGNNSPDPHDDNGWFLDPTPHDHSEFGGTIINAFAGDAHSGSPAFNKPDFYTVVALEMTHAMGLLGNFSPLWAARTTNTNITDTAEGGGTGTFWTFNGPSIKHLLTSNNGGPAIFGGTNMGMAIHSAGPGVPVSFNGDTYIGAEDQGNALFELGRRYLVNNAFALMLKDAYGYSTVNPAKWGTFYSNLEQATKTVTVRGGDFASGQANSNDTISITRTGNTIFVSVDAGKDVPGTGHLPGAGDLPAWVTEYDASLVDFINIDAGAGDDTVIVASNVGKQVNVQGGAGTDSIVFNEPAPGAMMIATPQGFGSGSTVVSITGGFESASMVGNANPATWGVGGTAAGRPLTITGGTADDHFLISQIVGPQFQAPITIDDLGGDFAGNDVLTIEDSTISGTHTYTVTANQVQKNNGFAGITFSRVDRINLHGEIGNNVFNITTGTLCPVYVNGGPSFDVYNVVNTASSTPVFILSGAGGDQLDVNTDNAGQARVDVNQSLTLGAINIGNSGLINVFGDGDTVLRTGTLSMNTQARINLTTNNMIVDYTGATPMPTIQALLNSGYAGGNWNGFGIRTTQGFAGGNSGIGFAEATDLFSSFPATFAGQQVDNTSILMRFTRYGDANLDRTVNLGDFNLLAANFGQTNRRWSRGDFNFDQTVNLSDFNLLAGNFGQMAVANGRGGSTSIFGGSDPRDEAMPLLD